MGLLPAMPIIPKTKAPEAKIYGKTCEIYSFSLKYHLKHQDNLFTYLLFHVTYVTVFNKCSDPGVKFANLRFFLLY